MEKLPTWMQGIKVSFICNNCPNRSTKNIAFLELDKTVHPAANLNEAADPAEEDAESDED